MQQLWLLFVTFLKINLLSPSGPASLGILHDQTVPRLISDEQFVEAAALLEILQEIHAGSYGLVVAGSHGAVVGPARPVGDITNRIVEGAKVPVLVAGSFHAQQ